MSISSTAGRVARAGNAVSALSKFGVNAFSEWLRQEVIDKHVRVSVVEPGIVETELDTHLPPEFRESVTKMTENVQRLQSSDIAEAVLLIASRRRRVAINKCLFVPLNRRGSDARASACSTPPLLMRVTLTRRGPANGS